jgi:hypothetical protein
MFARQCVYFVCGVVAGVNLAVAQPAPRSADAPPRHIYVPVDDLDAVIDRDRGGVMLTRDEYAELERAARAAAPDQLHLPESAVLSQADYAARISGDQLLVTVTAGVTNFTQSWTRLVLPAGGAGVESALLDGQPAKLARDPAQPTALVLYIAEPGTHALALELSTPLTAVGGDRAAAFNGAPTGVLTLTLPAGKHLAVSGQPERPPRSTPRLRIPSRSAVRLIRLRITDRAAAATVTH